MALTLAASSGYAFRTAAMLPEFMHMRLNRIGPFSILNHWTAGSGSWPGPAFWTYVRKPLDQARMKSSYKYSRIALSS